MPQTNKVTLLGWKGYKHLIKRLESVTPVPEDTFWWLENEYSEEMFQRIAPAQVQECKNADDVSTKFAQHSKAFDFVVVDREYRDEPAYNGRLKGLGMLGEKVLHSALPLLAARDYYAVDDNFALLPVRFGTNGVVCNREAIVALTERGVICREEVGRLEKCDLKRLLDSQASLSKMQFCRWKWEEPINKMLEKASRKLQSPDKFREQVLHLFNCEVDDWNAMASKLKEEGPVVILGPSEMLAAPINSEANQTQSVVDWFLVKDAELLWVETIACLPEEIRESGHKEDVAARRSNWLVGAALRLMADPWEAVTVKEGEYWGYPVLGWSVCSRDGPQKDKAVEAIRQIVGPERVKRFRGGNPGEWMSNFLMEAGLSLRESPPRSIPIVRQRVAYAV